MEKERGLGKGLTALIPERSTEPSEKIAFLKTQEVRPSRYQPRELFRQESLDELVASIRARGVIQPILVRPKDGGYEIIAGERRWRAVKALGIETIPAVVRDVPDSELLEISLIENLQREELNPIEAAKAYQRLMEEFHFPQEKIAQAIGKDRATISNMVRLLKLPQKIQQDVLMGTLSMGHARALLAVEGEKEQLVLAERIIAKGLSVREIEHLTSLQIRLKGRRRAADRPAHLIAIEEELQQIFGTRVRIIARRHRGRFHIEFYSLDDFDRIVRLLRRVRH